jgi:pSer/pThr/pTyr-binding forkhead associated (FHA) protein
MSSQQQERHVLLISDNQGKHAIALDAAAYSIGRDPSNAIVLDFDTVSRQHSILLRLPIPGTNLYKYRLVDGNSEGQPSSNGIFVNQNRCSTHELSNGDVIGFGRKVKATYLSLSMAESEFHKYLESIQFQSIKSKQLDPRATLVGAEMYADEKPSAPEKAREFVTVSAPMPSPLTTQILSSKTTFAHEENEGSPPGHDLQDRPLAETVHEPVQRKSSRLDIPRLISIGVVLLAATGTYLCLNSNITQPNPTAVQRTTPQSR